MYFNQFCRILQKKSQASSGRAAIYSRFGGACIHCKTKSSVRAKVPLTAACGGHKAANSPRADHQHPALATPDPPDLEGAALQLKKMLVQTPGCFLCTEPDRKWLHFLSKTVFCSLAKELPLSPVFALSSCLNTASSARSLQPIF